MLVLLLPTLSHMQVLQRCHQFWSDQGPGHLFPVNSILNLYYPKSACPTDKVLVTFLRSGGLIQDPFQGTREVKLDITTGGEHIFKMTDLSTAGKFPSKGTLTYRNI